MSLTSFLKSPDVKAKFERSIERPSLDLSSFKLAIEPRSDNYGVIGTAFDYLLRFNLQFLFPRKTISGSWFVETIPNYLDGKDHKRQKVTLEDAKKLHQQFLRDGRNSDRLLASCLKIGSLETYGRSGNPSLFLNYVVTKKDVADLKRLIRGTDWRIFTPKKRLILNPSFGKASTMIGGADADLIIDDTLLEIKCSKNLSRYREGVNQIFGYYLLNQLEKRYGAKRPALSYVAFYYPRFRAYFKFSVRDHIRKTSEEKLLRWLDRELKRQRRVRESFAQLGLL